MNLCHSSISKETRTGTQAGQETWRQDLSRDHDFPYQIQIDQNPETVTR